MTGTPYETYGQALARVPLFPAQSFQSATVPTYAPTYSAPTYYAQPAPRPSVWDTYRTAMLSPIPEAYSPLESAVTGLRHNGEGMAIAAALALYQRHVGSLDIRGRYPLDGILGAILLALSVKDSGKPGGYASDLRALSQSCTSVMMFRKIAGSAAETVPSTLAQNKGNSAAPLPDIPRNIPDIPRNISDPVLIAARKAGF